MTIRKVGGYGAGLGGNTFTGAQVAPSLALGGATIGSNALAVTGTTLFTGNVDSTGYTNTSTAFQAAAAGSFYWNARSLMASPSDGVIKLSNNAQTDFNRLQFGGTTSSFPALKRSSSALQVRLADDSGSAYFHAASYYMNFSSFITDSSDGVIRLSNNAGTDFSRLQFGGTTSSFPAIKRNLTALNFRLADDSADATITAATGTFSADITASGAILARAATAIPAGGTAGAGFRFSSTSNFGMFFGSGAPTLSAAKGSLYLRSDGTGVADRMYVNTNGSTTWTAVTTVA